MVRWLNERDEAQERRLLASQPESSGELAEFLARLEARVTEAVMADERVRERLGGIRHEVLAVDYREDKPEEGGARSRGAEVGIYDYDRDVLVVAAFDLYSGEVFEIFERVRAAPPVAPAEFERARELVAEVPGVGEAIRAECRHGRVPDARLRVRREPAARQPPRLHALRHVTAGRGPRGDGRPERDGGRPRR